MEVRGSSWELVGVCGNGVGGVATDDV